MLDQSFSAQNFKRILDYENRKGVNLEKRFFSYIYDYTKRNIGGINKFLRIKGKELSSKQVKILKEIVRHERAEKDEMDCTPKTGRKVKQVYSLNIY